MQTALHNNKNEEGLEIKIEEFGAKGEDLQQAASVALRNAGVLKYLKDTRHRLLSIEALSLDEEAKRSERSSFSDHYLATVYDYTNNRTIFIKGSIGKREVLEIEESSIQPLPSPDEFAEAVEIIKKHKEFSSAMKENQLSAYQGMPAIITEELPDGRSERTIAVILVSKQRTIAHEIVGVNMNRGKVVRYENGAPRSSEMGPQLCGVPAVSDGGPAKGTPGQANVTVKVGNTIIWQFQVIRPAASSGIAGSGVELRHVKYKGKTVLYRAHVPILNVKYDQDACGPYRDWQWQEHLFEANGVDKAPGIRLCNSPAKTILDSNSDAGNFHGVAIYVKGQEVVLVSEMQAGWYRYISEWRLHTNGTIKPRFGFGATNNSCVCNVHHHHAYWRLDFDIETASNNVVREYNNPPIIGSSSYHTKNYEIRRLKDKNHKRHWEVKNASSGNGYAIIPGANDGIADNTFGYGDAWILKYHGNELDDGIPALGAPAQAQLDKFLTGENIFQKDVVIWYGAHFTHDINNEGSPEVVGPELKVIKW